VNWAECPYCESPAGRLVCPKCHNYVEDDWRVCSFCGTPLIETIGYYCSECGNDVQDDWNVCPSCGIPLNETKAASRGIIGARLPAIDSQIKGYASKEHKDKFRTRAIILAVLFIVGQFVLPIIILVAFIFTTGFEFTRGAPDRGAYWNDAIWYVEDTYEIGADFDDYSKLKRIDLALKSDLEDVQQLSMDDPWLVTDDDRLWLISRSGLAHYSNNSLTIIDDDQHLWDISSVFVYQGQPAMVSETRIGFNLEVYKDNHWEQICRIDTTGLSNSSEYADRLQVVSSQDELHLFYSNDERIYYSQWKNETEIGPEANWQYVASYDFEWHPVWLNGEPAVFSLTNGAFPQEIECLTQIDYGDQWAPIFSLDTGMTLTFGVYPLSQDGQFSILAQSLTGSTRMLISESDGTVVNEKRYGSPWGFFSGGFLMMYVFISIIGYLLPLMLVVALSSLMNKYRERNYIYRETSIPYASLTRRGIAEAIDIVIACGVMGVGYLGLMLSESGFEAMMLSDPSASPTGYGLLIGGVLWGIACLFIFSYTEGRWGITPGKWAVGIKVLNTELHPCGFVSGLVRNLLEIVDGFTSFMLGIMFIAFTENWQRIGDIAAKTVVIDIRKSPSDQ
jgi:uncharacterized RDD family membrane protein YckC